MGDFNMKYLVSPTEKQNSEVFIKTFLKNAGIPGASKAEYRMKKCTENVIIQP